MNFEEGFVVLGCKGVIVKNLNWTDTEIQFLGKIAVNVLICHKTRSLHVVIFDSLKSIDHRQKTLPSKTKVSFAFFSGKDLCV